MNGEKQSLARKPEKSAWSAQCELKSVEMLRQQHECPQFGLLARHPSTLANGSKGPVATGVSGNGEAILTKVCRFGSNPTVFISCAKARWKAA